MLSVGIVGLPNVGKSTLFNTLLKKQQAVVANYPFTTIEPNVGIVPVPDERLEELGAIIKAHEKIQASFQVIPATVRFVDIAGLVKNAHKGEGLGNQFLAHIREADALVLLLRDFSDETVAYAGPQSPEEQLEILKEELSQAKIEKPSLMVVNTDHPGPAGKFLTINAKSGEGIDRLIKEAYRLLNLITFYSYNEKELRAWSIKEGGFAPEAAGKIHSDFEKAFIKAEVIQANKLIEATSWQKAREKGFLRQEGKNYPVQDGDIIYFKAGRRL